MWSIKSICKSLFILICVAAHAGYAQVSLPNNISASYVTDKPKIDGKLDDEVWKTATKINNFTQRELKIGEPASERTEVAIVTTEQFLYVGVWCYDSKPNKIIS